MNPAIIAAMSASSFAKDQPEVSIRISECTSSGHASVTRMAIAPAHRVTEEVDRSAGLALDDHDQVIRQPVDRVPVQRPELLRASVAAMVDGEYGPTLGEALHTGEVVRRSREAVAQQERRPVGTGSPAIPRQRDAVYDEAASQVGDTASASTDRQPVPVRRVLFVDVHLVPGTGVRSGGADGGWPGGLDGAVGEADGELPVRAQGHLPVGVVDLVVVPGADRQEVVEVGAAADVATR